MNQEELEKEVEEAVPFFRLTMKGGYKDFDTLPELVEKLLNRESELSYASVRKLYEIPNKYAYNGGKSPETPFKT